MTDVEIKWVGHDGRIRLIWIDDTSRRHVIDISEVWPTVGESQMPYLMSLLQRLAASPGSSVDSPVVDLGGTR